MSDKPQKQTTAKTAWATFSSKYLPELLVSLYSYCVMVKSVSLAVVCVEGGFSQIQSQLIIHIIEIDLCCLAVRN